MFYVRLAYPVPSPTLNKMFLAHCLEMSLLCLFWLAFQPSTGTLGWCRRRQGSFRGPYWWATSHTGGGVIWGWGSSGVHGHRRWDVAVWPTAVGWGYGHVHVAVNYRLICFYLYCMYFFIYEICKLFPELPALMLTYKPLTNKAVLRKIQKKVTNKSNKLWRSSSKITIARLYTGGTGTESMCGGTG